jgi:hypothetical protein
VYAPLAGIARRLARTQGHDQRAEITETPTRIMKRTTGDGIRYIGKGLATLASAGVCGVLIWTTKGESGIGWFVLSLCIIW